MYFKLSHNENGDFIVSSYDTKETLLAVIGDSTEGPLVAVFSKHIVDVDPQYWGNNAIIIKGEVVVPTVKQAIEYDIE